MAKATIKMPEEFLLKVSRLGAKTDEILPRVLEAMQCLQIFSNTASMVSLQSLF